MIKKNIIYYQTMDLSKYTILIIDTSLNKIVVSVTRNYSLLSYKVIEYNRNYDEVLIDSLKEVLLNSNVNFYELDYVAVAIGPGNFTGIRVGMASARAIGMSLDCPVVGFTSLAALASEVFIDPGDVKIYSIIQAKRSRVYGQLFDINRSPLTKPIICGVEELDQVITENALPITNSEETSIAKNITYKEAGVDGIMLAAYDSLHHYIIKNTRRNYKGSPSPLYISGSGAKPPSNWKNKPILKV